MARARLASIGLVLAVLAVVGLRAGQAVSISGNVPERAGPSPTGTGLIMGRVVDADSNRPVGGAVVYVSMTAPRQAGFDAVMTDDQGRFVIRDLPTGTMSLRTGKAGYVDGAYTKRWAIAANGTGDLGQPIKLGDDEHVADITIQMWKYGSISGAVTDETGDPIVGITVRALPRKIIGGRVQYSIEQVSGYTARTDDRGMFRLGSLGPGDYIVAVPVITASAPRIRPPTTPTGAITDEYASSSSPLMTWLEGSRDGLVGSALDGGDASFTLLDIARSGPANTPAVAGVTADGRILTYETQFYPGVSSISGATRIGLKSGDDRAGVNFQLRPVPAVKVSGTLSGPSGPSPNTVIRLVSADTNVMSTDPEVGETLTGPDGRFTFLGVTPGSYVIKALRVPRLRAAPSEQSTTVMSAGTSGGSILFGGSGITIPDDPALWGEAPVTVGDRDVGDVALTLHAGARISGRVEFAGPAEKPAAPRGIGTIAIERADGQRSFNYAVTAGQVDAQWRFTTYGQQPGKYFVRVQYLPASWYLKGVMFGGQDVSIVPLEIAESSIDGVVITLTDAQPSEISGAVTNERGQPNPEATVVAFPADRNLWRNTGQTPRNLRGVGVTSAGAYTIPNLPAGNYFVSVISGVLTDWSDPRNLEKLSRDAVRVQLGEGEKKTVPLHLKSGGEDADIHISGPFVPDEDAQTPPPARDAIVQTTGTAVISGVVISDDPQPHPMRRAHVALSGASLGAGGRGVITDETGRFLFTKLPAGRFALSASKPAYLMVSYGAKRIGGAGTTIALTDGQQLNDLSITLPRGAVVTGVIKDERGQPAAGIAMQVQQYRFLNGERRLQSATSGFGELTDDRGVYRVFGLDPGEYYISAAVRSASGSVHRTTESDLQDAQRLLQRSGLPGLAATAPLRGAAAGAPPHRATSMYAAVFYPGTTSEANAEAVKVGAGEERSGIDFAIQLVPTACVEGSVANPSGAVPPNLEIRLLPVTPTASSAVPNIMAMLPLHPKADGSFSFNGVAPGQYVVVATTGSAGRGTPAVAGLWASSDVSVNGADVSGIVLSLQPSMTLSGRVAFEGVTTAPPADLATVRVSLAPAISGSQVAVGQLSTNATSDGSFTLAGLMPGRYMLRALPAVTEVRAGWVLKSAVVKGHDASDDPFELRGGDTIADATITFTDQTCELSGTLQDASGRPAPDYFIITFPEDRSLWRPTTRRIQQVRPANDGRFIVRNLLPGNYLIAALTDVVPGQSTDPAFLEQLAPGAIKIALAEGEKKTQDIRIK